jgi:hypothetical protein
MFRISLSRLVAVALVAVAACSDPSTSPRELSHTPEFRSAPAVPTAWDTIPFPADFTAEIGAFTGKSVWGTSPSDLFVVGTAQNPARGAVIHWDGSQWTEQASIPGEGLVSISGSTTGDVFAVSPTVILQYDGSQWSRVPGPLPASTFVAYASVWAESHGQAFLGGAFAPGDTARTLLARHTGTRWNRMQVEDFGPGFAAVVDVSGSSASNVWAVGRTEKCDDCNGTIAVVARRQGQRWRVAFRQPANNDVYRGITTLSRSNVWVAGQNSEGNAIVVHYDGSTWTTVEPLSTPELGLNDIWGSAQSNVYAVGPGGLLHYDGTAWSKVPGIKGDRVWGLSSADVYVVQATQLVHGR